MVDIYNNYIGFRLYIDIIGNKYKYIAIMIRNKVDHLYG